MIRMLFGAAVLFAMNSCSLQKQTTHTAKTLNIYGSGVIQRPVLTNLKVRPGKITTRYSGAGSQDIELHKSLAVAQAMQENAADVIIEPSYEITSTASGVTIVLTGYAGSYENFRPLTGADTSLLVHAGIITYNHAAPETTAVVQQKKKSKAGLIILAVLIAAGAGAASSLL